MSSEGGFCEGCGQKALKRCTRCRIHFFCGRDCQLKHFRRYKGCGIEPAPKKDEEEKKENKSPQVSPIQVNNYVKSPSGSPDSAGAQSHGSSGSQSQGSPHKSPNAKVSESVTGRSPNVRTASAPSNIPRLQLYGDPYAEFIEKAQREDRLPDLCLLAPRCGLYNMGNTCYLNAALQALACTPSLHSILSTLRHYQSHRDPHNCFLCAFEKICYDLQTRSPNNPIEPEKFLRATRSKMFGTALSPTAFGGQADSQECLGFLIELLQESIIPKDTNRDPAQTEELERSSLIGHLFSLDCGQAITCKNCNKENIKESVEYNLRLEITAGMTQEEIALARNPSGRMFSRFQSSRSSTRSVDLIDLIEDYLRAEQLDDYKCDGCEMRGTCSKRTKILRLPNILTIFVDLNKHLGMWGKVHRELYFPMHMDLGESEYALYAIIVHLDLGGSTFFGHYVTFVRGGDDDQWLLCDDEEVRPVDAAVVMKQQPIVVLYQMLSPVTHSLARPGQVYHSVEEVDEVFTTPRSKAEDGSGEEDNNPARRMNEVESPRSEDSENYYNMRDIRPLYETMDHVIDPLQNLMRADLNDGKFEDVEESDDSDNERVRQIQLLEDGIFPDGIKNHQNALRKEELMELTRRHGGLQGNQAWHYISERQQKDPEMILSDESEDICVDIDVDGEESKPPSVPSPSQFFSNYEPNQSLHITGTSIKKRNENNHTDTHTAASLMKTIDDTLFKDDNDDQIIVGDHCNDPEISSMSDLREKVSEASSLKMDISPIHPESFGLYNERGLFAPEGDHFHIRSVSSSDDEIITHKESKKRDEGSNVACKRKESDQEISELNKKNEETVVDNKKIENNKESQIAQSDKEKENEVIISDHTGIDADDDSSDINNDKKELERRDNEEESNMDHHEKRRNAKDTISSDIVEQPAKEDQSSIENPIISSSSGENMEIPIQQERRRGAKTMVPSLDNNSLNENVSSTNESMERIRIDVDEKKEKCSKEEDGCTSATTTPSAESEETISPVMFPANPAPLETEIQKEEENTKIENAPVEGSTTVDDDVSETVFAKESTTQSTVTGGMTIANADDVCDNSSGTISSGSSDCSFVDKDSPKNKSPSVEDFREMDTRSSTKSSPESDIREDRVSRQELADTITQRMTSVVSAVKSPASSTSNSQPSSPVGIQAMKISPVQIKAVTQPKNQEDCLITSESEMDVNDVGCRRTDDGDQFCPQSIKEGISKSPRNNESLQIKKIKPEICLHSLD